MALTRTSAPVSGTTKARLRAREAIKTRRNSIMAGEVVVEDEDVVASAGRLLQHAAC